MKKINQFIQRERQSLEDFITWYQERNRHNPERYPLELEEANLAYWQRLYRNFKAGSTQARKIHESPEPGSDWPANLSQFLSAQSVKRTCPGLTVTTNE